MRNSRPMKRVLASAFLLLAALPAAAQQPTAQQEAVLTDIAKCLVAGLPEDWEQAEMTIKLPASDTDKGDVRYVFRRKLSGGTFENFRPCDAQMPPRALAGLRELQPPERRGWEGARFVMHRDGKFDVTFDYPGAKPK